MESGMLAWIEFWMDLTPALRGMVRRVALPAIHESRACPEYVVILLQEEVQVKVRKLQNFQEHNTRKLGKRKIMLRELLSPQSV